MKKKEKRSCSYIFGKKRKKEPKKEKKKKTKTWVFYFVPFVFLNPLQYKYKLSQQDIAFIVTFWGRYEKLNSPFGASKIINFNEDSTLSTNEWKGSFLSSLYQSSVIYFPFRSVPSFPCELLLTFCGSLPEKRSRMRIFLSYLFFFSISFVRFPFSFFLEAVLKGAGTREFKKGEQIVPKSRKSFLPLLPFFFRYFLSRKLLSFLLFP